MANFDKFFPTLIKHEGGFVDNPSDKGGATNLGVTIATWKRFGYDKDGDGDIDVSDLKKLTLSDAKYIAKTQYWDKVWGDKINSQSIAEFLFDWAYNSGPSTAILRLQHILGPSVKNDGIMGKNTISVLNQSNPKKVFEELKKSREAFYHTIVRTRPKNKVFLKGWLTRLNSFSYKD